MSGVSNPLRPQWVTKSQSQARSEYKQLSSIRDLAAFWQVRPSQLSYYAFYVNKKRAYRAFHVRRRNGRQRLIEAPNRTLKYLQRILHESLTLVYGPHPAVHGFVPKHSIVTNAQQHLGSRYVLNIDLENFFPSITRERIYGRLAAAPYLFNPVVANAVAALATNFYSRLPQGSPSSPVLANIVASEMDADLTKLARAHGCWYTRYADDITISTPRGELSPQLGRYPNARGTSQVAIGDGLASVIEQHSFKINYRKTRLQSYWTRQICTGLVVNGGRASPPRSYIRRLRSLLDHWCKNGWQDAAQVLHTEEHRSLFQDRQSILNHVIGRVGYIKMVRGQNDKVALRLEQIVSSLP